MLITNVFEMHKKKCNNRKTKHVAMVSIKCIKLERILMLSTMISRWKQPQKCDKCVSIRVTKCIKNEYKGRHHILGLRSCYKMRYKIWWPVVVTSEDPRKLDISKAPVVTAPRANLLSVIVNARLPANMY